MKYNYPEKDVIFLLIFGLLNGRSLIDIIISILVCIPAVIIAVTFHEVSHGYAAYMCGDNTAKWAGRLTLNPKAHFDLFGAISMLLIGYGWAKPVPVNPNNFRKMKFGMIIVALAGPFANLLLAVISYLIFGSTAILTYNISNPTAAKFIEIFIQMLYQIYRFDIVLMVFNLIPIPPLDGSKVLFSLLPRKAYNFILNYERYGSVILIALLFTGLLDTPINFFVNIVERGLYFCASPLFNALVRFVM